MTVLDWCVWVPLGVVLWTLAVFTLLLFIGLLGRAACEEPEKKKP